MGTKIKLKSLTPMRDQILVTADRYPKEEKLNLHGRILKLDEMPNGVKPYQKIVACGPMAHNIPISEGDNSNVYAMLTFLRYQAADWEERPNQDKPDVVQMGKNKMNVNLPIYEIDGKEYMLIYANDIKFIFTGEEVNE